MVCVAGAGRIVLIIVNSISGLAGAAFIAIGCVIKFYLGSLLKSTLVETVSKVAYALFVGNSPVPETLDFGPLTDTVGVIFIAVGTVLIAISLIGCCAVCCSFRPVLVCFCILLGLLVVGQIFFYSFVLTRNSVVHDKARKTLKDDLRTDYNRINVSTFTISADIIFMSAECCGVEGPLDFANHTKLDFTVNNTLKVDHPLIPPSCCQRTYITSLDWKCVKNLTMASSQGCYSRLQDILEDWRPWLVAVIVITLLVQLGEIVAAVMIYKDE